MKQLRPFILMGLLGIAGCAYIATIENSTALRERLLKAKQDAKHEKSVSEGLYFGLTNSQHEINILQKTLSDYKTNFNIVDYQWMTNEVQTCHLALKDGQRSTNMGRWPVEWNARQQAWLQRDAE